ncbi:AAA family ATPase [Phenylobacterium sp.]|jgi:hypothetical protein|uniref:AAA family ATPase n=1 Tax=Phenylobacterium sp. TaxID=1871053 RepID=UPI0037C98C35
MPKGCVTIVTGPPGAGKSTVARRLAGGTSADLGMHIHTDDIYTYIQKGFVPPWDPASQAQNAVLMDAIAAQAAVCAKGGYDVYVDGIVGGWFFDPWLSAARTHDLGLRYVLLQPNLAATLSRATARTAPGAMTDPDVVGQMWEAFRAFEIDPAHIVDTTGQTIEQTVTLIEAGLKAGRFRLA